MKYIIEFGDKPSYQDDNADFYPCKQIPWWSVSTTYIRKLTPIDKELIEAYQKGYNEAWANVGECEDRVAKQAYQKGLNDSAKVQESATDAAYRCGLNAAWEAAKKISLDKAYGGLEYTELDMIFGTRNTLHIMHTESAQEVIDKIRAYEEQQKVDEIKVGDEVMNTLGTMDNAVGYFFGDSSDGCYKVLRYVDGKFKTGIWHKENCARTGKHSDAVERMLAVMQEGAE